MANLIVKCPTCDKAVAWVASSKVPAVLFGQVSTN